MRPFKVLAVSASGSLQSKTAAVADHVLSRLASPQIETAHLRLRQLPLAAMLDYPFTDPVLQAANREIEDADGLILATPIHKASFSGLLKLWLDQLPQFGLAGKTVLPIATGGSLAHALAIDFSLRPVLQSMGVRHAVQGYMLPEAHVSLSGGGLALAAEADAPLEAAIHHFRDSLIAAGRDQMLGHPRPAAVPA